MFTKDEIKEQKIAFWSAFEQRMKPHRSAQYANKINWQHYKTNINHLYFRIETGENSVSICVDIQHKDEGIRQLFYEQFTELKVVMQQEFTVPLEWFEHYEHSNGLTISRIACTKNCNYLDKHQQEDILDFLEKNLLGLDRFWVEYKDVLYQLK